MDIFGTILNIIIAAIGFYALLRGEVPFSPTRRVTDRMARVVGVIFIAAAVMGFYPETLWVSSLLLIVGLILGWTLGKRIPPNQGKKE
jgi:hypothetical protein